MHTLVELYDKEPIENLLAAAVFRPDHIVYLCGKHTLNNRRKNALYRFLKRKNLKTKLTFYVMDTTDIGAITRTLEKTHRLFPDCVFEFTGGTDLLLLCSGVFCKENKIPGFYVDLRAGRMINVFGCEALLSEFHVPTLSVPDILTAAGASQDGHGHNVDIESPAFLKDALAVWNLIAADQSGWARMVSYLQHVTKTYAAGDNELAISAPDVVMTQSHPISRCNYSFLQKLADLDVIRGLTKTKGRVAFSYKSQTLKRCLINHGIWLELYGYIMAKQSGYFNDVQTSVIIDWDGENTDYSETRNELDLILVHGITPLFVSCKTATPSPLSLSEVALIARRFGGELARAVLLSSSHIARTSMAVYKRAKELGVYIIDMDDIEAGHVQQVLKSIVDGTYIWKH